MGKLAAVEQPIVGWHRDEHGDWVAELACGHGQHVRHTPPLSFRPWVLEPEGRARFVGFPLRCVRCADDRLVCRAREGDTLDQLSTERLVIRSFVETDLDHIHRILNEAFGPKTEAGLETGREERRSWLEWNALSARWLPAMGQPPYGDRAVVVKATGEVIGAAGLVPLLLPFDQIPELGRTPGPGDSGRTVPEVGLFWAIDPAHQGRGYATEAGAGLVDYAFAHLRLWRVLATTEYDNHASQAVMRKLGMTLTRNPRSEPEWMQVVGVLYAEPPMAVEGLLT